LLAGFIYPAFGKDEEAAEAGETAIQLNPDFAFGYVNLGHAYLRLGQLKLKKSSRGLPSAK
jgi:hypothetical protein